MADQFKIEWIDSGREPKCTPDPAWPDGKDFDATMGVEGATCVVHLEHPTPRCGFYIVTCNTCGLKIAATTAGRVDDPRTLKLLCKRKAH